MKVKKINNSFRHDVIRLLKKDEGNIGVELGVAKGVFSSRMMQSGKFSYFFGVDMYSDRHDTEEYKGAINRIGLFANYKLLRMRFDEAYDLFEDESLDFVYIDGYAHNGEEGGSTIFDWSKKVKIGGVISGDDYHKDWPLVIEAVDEFMKKSNFELYITTSTEDNPYCNYPSWVTIKKSSTRDIYPSEELLKKGIKARRPKRNFISVLKYFLLKIIPKKIIEFIKHHSIRL